MKKIIFSIVTLVTFGFADAQINEKGTVEITPKIGVSDFNEYFDNDFTKSIYGVELGITGDYYFNPKWSLRTGLIADKMGGKYFDSDNYLYVDKLNYLSIPINANWHFGYNRLWNLNFGLSPSFLINAKINGIEIPDNDIEPFQLGINLGIGFKIEFTKKFSLLVDSQFFGGLTDTNKTSSTEITNTGVSYNLGGVFHL